MNTFLLIIHVLIAFSIIGLVLIQHGKGADVGASFGSGASTTIFGSQGSGSFLSKATIILALLFVISSIAIHKLGAKSVSSDVIDVEKITIPDNFDKNNNINMNLNVDDSKLNESESTNKSTSKNDNKNDNKSVNKSDNKNTNEDTVDADKPPL